MKTLVISKPYYDYILPLVEFPKDGDRFIINNAVNTVNNIGSLIAITIAKYGGDVSITGMIGDDENGKKIVELFNQYKIDTRYIEISFKEKTSSNYKIYSSKTNTFTTIEAQSIKTGITKYKYDFTPETIIMDDSEYEGNLAAINNFPESNLIYVANKFGASSKVYCNKCNYIISNITFASNASGVTNNLNNPKNIVQLYQKYIDLYKSNLIIILNNFDVLYCIDDEVRIIKNVNNSLKNKDVVFKSVLAYYLSITKNIELSIKLTNKAMESSAQELDMIKNIPGFEVIAKLNQENIKPINNIEKKEEIIESLKTDNGVSVNENA